MVFWRFVGPNADLGSRIRGEYNQFLVVLSIFAAALAGYAALEVVKRRTVRILLAEDNLVNQKVAVKMLNKLGYHVDVANDGKMALDAIESDKYDIVFLDVQMPKKTGYEVAEEVRRREGVSADRARLVAMTAHAMEGDREKCIEAGMDDYISKPIDRDELQRVLERNLPAYLVGSPSGPSRESE